MDISTSVIWDFIFAIMIGNVKQLIKYPFLKTVLGNQASNVHAFSNGTYAYSLGFSHVNNVEFVRCFNAQIQRQIKEAGMCHHISKALVTRGYVSISFIFHFFFFLVQKLLTYAFKVNNER